MASRAKRLNITVDGDVLEFIDRCAPRGNRSAFVNTLLKKARTRILEEQLKQAHLAENEDPDYLAALEDWDGVVADGLTLEAL